MGASTTATGTDRPARERVQIDNVTIRFCGDSGDGMQLAGTQFTNTSALFGNDVSTLPDFPAEIRAPAGSLAGVSGFQVHFSSQNIHTPGDKVHTLVAMNPAALKTNLADLVDNGFLVVNQDAFTKGNLKKAGYEKSPLEDGSLSGYQVFEIPIDSINKRAVEETGMTGRDANRSRNFVALGLVYWLYDRSMDATIDWVKVKFGKKPEVAEANIAALKAGFYYGETVEAFPVSYKVPKAKLAPGKYRKISGNEATAIGLTAAAALAKKTLFYGTYPITPASDILHMLARYKNYGVKTFQAEDEIAAITSTIGAAFAGAFAVTGTSGPGVALKGEAMGLAVMLELPLVVVNVQRGGPSTGLPTKTEQADLMQAIYGRNGECPMPVIAARSPGDCFYMALEAFRIATEYMTPVMLLTDGYLANGAEPWAIPDIDKLPKFDIKHPQPGANGAEYEPYARDDKLSRPWAIPGTPKLQHRIGGLEKEHITGDVNYDPENHQFMVDLRAKKVANVADSLPPVEIEGDSEGGDLLVIGWGGTYGAIKTAVDRSRDKGLSVSNVHLNYLFPMQRDLGDVLGRFKKVLVPELNLGQLRTLLQANYLIESIGMNKVQGKPFLVSELCERIEAICAGNQ
jgi:2-oxoglutarate ferredoxin oxidoreductase subunit alpha